MSVCLQDKINVKNGHTQTATCTHTPVYSKWLDYNEITPEVVINGLTRMPIS